LAYLDRNTLPKRFDLYKESSIFWYAMFANAVDYYYQDVAKGSEADKVQALYELCDLFSERGIFTDIFNDREVVNMTVMEFSRENELKYASRAEGREEGIIAYVELLAELGYSTTAVLEKIMGKFNLAPETAQKYVDEHYRIH